MRYITFFRNRWIRLAGRVIGTILGALLYPVMTAMFIFMGPLWLYGAFAAPHSTLGFLAHLTIGILCTLLLTPVACKACILDPAAAFVRKRFRLDGLCVA